jgi:hypothetical protein
LIIRDKLVNNRDKEANFRDELQNRSTRDLFVRLPVSLVAGWWMSDMASDFALLVHRLPTTGFLPVGGFGAMFALVMVFGDVAGEARCGRAQGDGAVSEAGDVFEQVGVFYSCGWGFSPGKGGVAADQDAGDGDGVEAPFFEEMCDDCAGVEDVGLRDFVGAQLLGYGNFAVEIVGVGGAEAGDRAASLRPGGGEFGVGVDDAADLRKLAIEQKVRIQVAGGIEVAFYDGAVKPGEDEIGGGQCRVVYAAGLDGD